jgi:hypothetical protein
LVDKIHVGLKELKDIQYQNLPVLPLPMEDLLVIVPEKIDVIMNIILYRGREFEENEKPAAEKVGFMCTNSRMDIRSGDLVIGRYSVLPYHDEQERDINAIGARMINTTRMHNWIADVGSWACEDGALYGRTFRTWNRIEDVPDGIPLVVKGQTNSMKFQWSQKMYAPDKKSAIDIYLKLSDDSLIGQQTIYFREYLPLVRLMTGLNGLPISKEFRFFVYNGVILSGGFYWSSHVADLTTVPSIEEVPLTFLWEAVESVAQHANFFALDIAQKEDGNWVVVEINDGCQSGISENKPETLYSGLMRALSTPYDSFI